MQLDSLHLLGPLKDWLRAGIISDKILDDIFIYIHPCYDKQNYKFCIKKLFVEKFGYFWYVQLNQNFLTVPKLCKLTNEKTYLQNFGDPYKVK